MDERDTGASLGGATAAGASSGDTRLDAMGQDKYRRVTGKSYGPTKARQGAVFAIFIAVVIALFFAGRALVDELDKPPQSNPAEAPWAAPGAPQTPPARPE